MILCKCLIKNEDWDNVTFPSRSLWSMTQNTREAVGFLYFKAYLLSAQGKCCTNWIVGHLNETKEQNHPDAVRTTGGGRWVHTGMKGFFCEVQVQNTYFNEKWKIMAHRKWHKVSRREALQVQSQQLSKECCCFYRLTQSCEGDNQQLNCPWRLLMENFIWTCISHSKVKSVTVIHTEQQISCCFHCMTNDFSDIRYM